MAKVWDEGDNKFLRENYLTLSNQDLADMFGVSKKSIQGKLRRLGLHRNNPEECDEIQTDEKAVEQETTEEISRIRRQRLSFDIPEPPKKVTVKRHAYKPRELTERRKRGMREFDRAMKLFETGDKEKAFEEMNFIIRTFTGEYDIIEKANMYLRVMNKSEKADLETSEDFYMNGLDLLKVNDLDGAMSSFQKALELDPEYLDAKYNIACLECLDGNFDESVKLLSEVFEVREHFVEIAIYDNDLTPLLENESFQDLANSYK